MIYDEFADHRFCGEGDLKYSVLHFKEVRCIIPLKRCWDSNKSLFLKKCVKVTCHIPGPGDSIFTHYYFEPKRWTIRLLKQ